MIIMKNYTYSLCFVHLFQFGLVFNSGLLFFNVTIFQFLIHLCATFLRWKLYLKFRLYQSFIHYCLQIPTLIQWLKMPQSVVSYYSVLSCGGQGFLLVSPELYFAVSGKAGKAGPLSPTVFHAGQMISGFWNQRRSLQGLLTARLGSHTSSLPPLILLLKAKQRPVQVQGEGKETPPPHARSKKSL